MGEKRIIERKIKNNYIKKTQIIETNKKKNSTERKGKLCLSIFVVDAKITKKKIKRKCLFFANFSAIIKGKAVNRSKHFYILAILRVLPADYIS